MKGRTLITTAQAARLLARSPSTLKRWRQTGEVPLPYYRPPGCRSVRYDLAEVRALIEGSRIVPGQEPARPRRAPGSLVVLEGAAPGAPGAAAGPCRRRA